MSQMPANDRVPPSVEIGQENGGWYCSLGSTHGFGASRDEAVHDAISKARSDVEPRRERLQAAAAQIATALDVVAWIESLDDETLLDFIEANAVQVGQVADTEAELQARVVVSRDWGGSADGALALSDEAKAVLRARGVEDAVLLDRDDPRLVEAVETLGDEAGAPQDVLADRRRVRLGIVEIPGDVDWTVPEVDGVEWVAERHRRWSVHGQVDPSDTEVPPRVVRADAT